MKNLFYMLVGLASVIEGLVLIISFGFINLHLSYYLTMCYTKRLAKKARNN